MPAPFSPHRTTRPPRTAEIERGIRTKIIEHDAPHARAPSCRGGAVKAGHERGVCHVRRRRESGKTGALPMKPLDVLMPAKGMDLIDEQISARLPLHRLWLEPNPDLWLAEWAPRIRAVAMIGRTRAARRSLYAPISQARDHLQFRRRLRQYRRQGGGAAWNHRHQYARRARRRSRRHDARPHDHDRAPACRSRNDICAPGNGRRRALSR